MVAAADISCESLDDDAMVCLAPAGFHQLSVGDRRDFHLARSHIHNSTVATCALGVIVSVARVECAGHVSTVRAVHVTGGAAGWGARGKSCGVEGAGV